MAASPLAVPSVAVIVGTAAALLSITSFAPQIIKIVREKDASSVSLRTYVVTVAGFACWLAYGLMIKAWPVAAAVLALKWRYGRQRDGKDVKG
jgi:MtN3 and saliva related transmembrane protein